MENSLVTEYINGIKEPDRSVLEKIRETVKDTVPEAVEVFSYGMPGFKYKGKYLIGYASFKDHLSLFPTPGPIEGLREKLSMYKITKGTIHFSQERLIPEDLLKEILRNRAEGILQE